MGRRGDLVIDRSELNLLLTFDEVDASRIQESRSRLGQQSTWDSVLKWGTVEGSASRPAKLAWVASNNRSWLAFRAIRRSGRRRLPSAGHAGRPAPGPPRIACR